MGNCVFSSSSCETTQLSTAKVVVHDGTMQEFSYPVKVAYLLQLYPACFICDSDDMAFDDVVTAVHEDHELKLGQLYFALPLTSLKRHLTPQEMAALAVIASSALAKCSSRRKEIVFLSGDGNAKPGRRVAPDGGATVDAARKGKIQSGGGSKGRGRGKFMATLSSVPEQG